MEKMRIGLVSLVERDGIVVARARAMAPAAAARIWVEVVFEPSGNDWWAEAYDRGYVVP